MTIYLGKSAAVVVVAIRREESRRGSKPRPSTAAAEAQNIARFSILWSEEGVHERANGWATTRAQETTGVAGCSTSGRVDRIIPALIALGSTTGTSNTGTSTTGTSTIGTSTTGSAAWSIGGIAPGIIFRGLGIVLAAVVTIVVVLLLSRGLITKLPATVIRAITRLDTV